MRKVAILLIALVALGCGARGAESSGGESKNPGPALPKSDSEEVEQRRDVNRKAYNEAFNKSMFSSPQEAQKLFGGAQTAMETSNPGDSGDPYVGLALFQRGYLAIDAGGYREAIELFEELVKRYPQHTYADDALYQIGYVYQKHLEDYGKAAEAYTRLAHMYRDRETAVQAMYQNAQVSVQQKDVQVEQMVEQLNDTADNAYKQRFSRGQFEVPNYYEAQSRQQLQRITANNPPGASQDALALWLKGDNDLQEGKLSDAQGNFAKIQEEYSGSKVADDAAFGLAECRRLAGKIDKAAELYADFIVKYPQSELAPRARFHLAEIKHISGQDEEARRLYESVLSSLRGSADPAHQQQQGQIDRPQLPAELRRCRDISARRLEELGAPPAQGRATGY